MAQFNYYFQHDTTSGVIYPYLQETAPATSPQIEVLGPYPKDTASTDVVMAYSYPERYTVNNGALTLKPYWTIADSVGTPAAGQYLIPHTLTATLNSPPATPATSCTFNIFGQSYTATVTNNQATLTVNVHPSITSQNIPVTVIETGTASGTFNLGNHDTSMALQSFIPTGSTTPQIAPTGSGSKSFLSNYWTAQAVNQAYSMADIQTALAVLLDAVFNVMGNTLTGATTDQNVLNAISDIKTNILPSLQTTLATAAPKPATGVAQSYDFHYSHFSHTMQSMKPAMGNYGNDVSTIPNLA